MAELLDAPANEHDASKDLEADTNPTSDATPVEVAEDSSPSLIEVIPEKLDTSLEGPVAAEESLVEDAQNEESTITQEPIPVHSLHEEMALESNIIGDSGALMSQESISATEESVTGLIVEEDSTPVAENQPVDETALSIEHRVEESTVELEDPITVPEPTAEEISAIVETTLELTMPVVEATSVVDKPASPAADADVSDQAALVAEGRTPLFVLVPA